MNTRNIIIVVVGIVLIILAAAFAMGWFSSSPQDQSTDETAKVYDVVTQFGVKLKAVSLQIEEAQLKTAITQQYQDFVTPELLASWMQNPASAPGRLTSSPWPDRIEISSAEKSGDKYTVKGEIIEISSTETGTEAAANKIPVTITLEKRNDDWLISSFDAQAQQAAFKQQGIITKNTPGLKANVWYLTYDQPGAAATRNELDVTGINLTNIYLYNGQVVQVEGVKNNANVVKVSKIEIINAKKNDLIWVATPLPNQTVESPLTVTGQARGNWFFEASFPIKLLDANGKVLAQAPAQAQGEWMTTQYVGFTLNLSFAKPTTATGTLVLEKDNPSGLPQNANELRIPVKFKQ